MIVNKIIETTEPMNIIFTNITLLSIEEYRKNRDLIPKVDMWWWLRSPGDYQDRASNVNSDGSIHDLSVSHESGCVRPVLKIFDPKSINLKSGNKLIIANLMWTYLEDGVLLCDTYVGETYFRKNLNSPVANVYEASDIKKWLENWAKEKGIEFENN